MVDTVTSYQAQTLHRNACQAWERAAAARVRGEPEEGHALTAVILAAAALEAFLNELVIVASRRSGSVAHVTEFSTVLADMDNSRASVRSRFFVARILLPGPHFDKGRRPYQDLDLRFALRDHVLHLRPEKLESSGGAPPKLQKRLSDRGLLPPPPRPVGSTLSSIQTSEVARWACDLVVEVIDFFREGAPSDTDTPDPVTHWLCISDFSRT
jgi:hypothetical protein